MILPLALLPPTPPLIVYWTDRLMAWLWALLYHPMEQSRFKVHVNTCLPLPIFQKDFISVMLKVNNRSIVVNFYSDPTINATQLSLQQKQKQKRQQCYHFSRSPNKNERLLQIHIGNLQKPPSPMRWNSAPPQRVKSTFFSPRANRVDKLSSYYVKRNEKSKTYTTSLWTTVIRQNWLDMG